MPEAGATQERRLEGVGWKRLFGETLRMARGKARRAPDPTRPRPSRYCTNLSPMQGAPGETNVTPDGPVHDALTTLRR